MKNAAYAAGASASINKTLDEIECILGGKKLPSAGPLREQLRAELQAAVIASSKRWYRKGFNRGHKECYRAAKSSGKVPSIVTAAVEREFVPKTGSKVKLKSTLSKSFRSTV